MRALEEYRAMTDQLPEEIAGNPHRLLGLMGTPAADMLKNEIREDREEGQKKDRKDREKKNKLKNDKEKQQLKVSHKASVRINKMPSFKKVNQGKDMRICAWALGRALRTEIGGRCPWRVALYRGRRATRRPTRCF